MSRSASARPSSPWSGSLRANIGSETPRSSSLSGWVGRKVISFANPLDQILRSHVMVRVGGGWDTLQNYLDKHDPCRCRRGELPPPPPPPPPSSSIKPLPCSGHRSTIGATMSVRSNKSPMAVGVTYDRYSSRKKSGRGPRSSKPPPPNPPVPSLAR